ncbi:Type 1 glutamine amidotransferase-like domain-containing protein [Paenibacillus sp. SC116]|uniref:Type 1 glutamine amidotransferase-like domain-containing protein n=1 Tax=Paenibacillus sp. SC116 TaxID=2968986 RepID=UPI00215B69D5|nr:Type 1 glutamine amidotransferase-like domain-containing protein [Paenibacillus sp. SC116]MCR8842682.1 Type 1 glutamine amidotransferase-like domain-containing protein [Paenibacillus sp. SC116]
MPKYTDRLEQNDITDFVYFILTPVPSDEMLAQLQLASGIVICGGDTELYRDYIVDSEIGALIRARYEEGVPVAGFSAGALISPQVCVIPPIDNRKNEHLFLKGLGLIDNCVISAHFTFWNEEQNLLTAMEKTQLSLGYGIDDASGIYFKDEVVAKTAGQIHFYYANK